ncbi:hypothetical protein DBR11_21735 [Pedobacter sp. HMWF019]|uniref:hypothetical protein n=1 Tax=Pedobacter sp. HMWF019 TaxID=2056856 RepID=UPI000D341B9A|nr:hypothetical protein [Pedobacter sp. HMWF019]PTS95185.1 hypothetical protein DBR11_21735 [Pedobacter sp. HMWF019]
MKRKMNEKQEAESLFLRKWCLTIIDFIYSDKVIQTDLIELRKQAFSEETKTRYLEQTTPGIYLKGLRQAYNDINDMALNAPNQILEKLNNSLFAQFGKDLSTDSQNISSRLEEIVDRGKIINDEEFRVVEQKVSDISQIDAQSQQIIILNNLLATYYMSKK